MPQKKVYPTENSIYEASKKNEQKTAALIMAAQREAAVMMKLICK